MNLFRHQISIQLYSSNETNASAGINRSQQFPVGCSCGQTPAKTITIINQSVTQHPFGTPKLQMSLLSHRSADVFFHNLFLITDDTKKCNITVEEQEHLTCSTSQWTDRRSRSWRGLAEVGTQEGSRVRCVPGTSISLHPHISLPPTCRRARPWRSEDIVGVSESGCATFHWFHVWLCASLDTAEMGLGSMEDEKNGVFPTISNDFAPPPPFFWSSAVLPLQSPPLFSWAFCSRYCLLPSSPSVQKITVKIISNVVILIYKPRLFNIIVYFLQIVSACLLCRLIWFLCLLFSVTIFFLFMFVFFLWAAHTKQILQHKKVILPNAKFQQTDKLIPLFKEFLMDNPQI